MTNNHDKGKILLYQTADGQSKIEVTLSKYTVWLSLDQILKYRRIQQFCFLQEFKLKNNYD